VAPGISASASPYSAVGYEAPTLLGWAKTKGGAGGQIIKVTTLAADGPGSLKAATDAKGPRTIVFEVGGVIDLGAKTLTIKEPFVTIAGQTAPSPGITLIRGGVDLVAHDAILQHIRVRTGTAGGSWRKGPEFDAFSTQGGAYNVVVDHCSFTWATDENMSASGPRFTGNTPDDWRQGASHNITYTNNIAAEGLAYAVHPKGEHSKGSLIHDNTSNILIYGNLYAHNYERNPLFKGGVRGAIVNNFIFDPGQRALHYNLMANEWAGYAPQVGRMTVVGNVLRGGISTAEGLRFLMIGGVGDLEYYGRDNLMVDRWGKKLEELGAYGATTAKIIPASKPLDWPEALTPLPANQVETYVLLHAGARPWDRDHDDIRIIADAAEGRGEIIDKEDQTGGYPVQAPTHRAFDASKWNADMSPKDASALDSGAKAKGT
jgi:hypothetical protein